MKGQSLFFSYIKISLSLEMNVTAFFFQTASDISYKSLHSRSLLSRQGAPLFVFYHKVRVFHIEQPSCLPD